MPNIGTVTISDGQATPVSHSFTAIGPQDGNSPAEWRDLVKPVRSQQWSLACSLRRANGSSTRDKVALNLYIPLVRTDVAGVQSVVDIASVRCDFTLPTSMTDTERKDLRALFKNFLATAVVTDYCENLLKQF